jgi:hypothetical protein
VSKALDEYLTGSDLSFPLPLLIVLEALQALLMPACLVEAEKIRVAEASLVAAR